MTPYRPDTTLPQKEKEAPVWNDQNFLKIVEDHPDDIAIIEEVIRDSGQGEDNQPFRNEVIKFTHSFVTSPKEHEAIVALVRSTIIHHTECIYEIKDAILTRLIEQGEFLNAGNNGIIFKIDTDKIPGLLFDIQAQEGNPINTDVVAKLLKISSSQARIAEFNAHRAAYDINVHAHHNDLKKKFARIPQPITHHTAHLTPEIHKTLMSKNQHAMMSSHADIIMMDFVPGEDLAAILCKFVLHANDPHSFSDELLATFSPEQLHSLAGEVAGYSTPGGKGSNEVEREFERLKVERENELKLYKLAQRQGFILNPLIGEKIKNTIFALNQENLHHNDLHHRNIMVAGGYGLDTPDPDVFIIDFGLASFGEHRTEGANDIAMAHEIIELTKSPSEKQREGRNKEHEKARLTLSRLRPQLELPTPAGNAWQATHERLKKKLETADIPQQEIIADETLLLPNEEFSLDKEFLSLVKCMEHGVIERESLIKACATISHQSIGWKKKKLEIYVHLLQE